MSFPIVIDVIFVKVRPRNSVKINVGLERPTIYDSLVGKSLTFGIEGDKMRTSNQTFPRTVSDTVRSHGWCELSFKQAKNAVLPGKIVSVHDIKGEVLKRASVMNWQVCFKSKSVIIYSNKV